ncbi:hypothetical protein LguiA_004100 [Lonicera macranthoides]
MTSKTESSTPSSQAASTECCMCGDYGLSLELFRCKLCRFRSQHRYCSNQYPKAESYRVCNWCLSQLVDSGKKAHQSSPNSSSSSKNSSDQDETKKNKKSNIINDDAGLKGKRGNLQLQINNRPIKKQRSPEHSPPASAGRKRITTIGVMEEREKLRRSKSMDLSKHVFRSKVRRYKLLDEVSSQ